MFDLLSAIPVREREDGLLEKDTFDLSSARPVEEISMDRNARYSPPADKDRATVELVYKEAGKKVPIGLKADWILTSKPAKMVTANILGAIATGGVIPFYNMAKGIADASSPKSDIGKMVFDSAYKGLAENEKVQNLGGSAQKAYPDAPWQITGAMGALAEVLMFMPGVVKSGAELLSKDKQFTIALNNARKSPKWGDYVSNVAKKANQPVEVVDQALYNKLWDIRGEADYFKVLNGNLKRTTGIDLFSEAGSIPISRAKVGQSVNFTDPQGIVKSGVIKELAGERAIIDLEGREVVATLSQLSLPKVEEVKTGVSGLESGQQNKETLDQQKSLEGNKETPEKNISAGNTESPQKPSLSQEEKTQPNILPEKAPLVSSLETSMPQETDPVKKVIEALGGAKDVRGQQETLYKKARAQKLAKMQAVGQKVKGEKGFFAEKGALKGELPKVEFESIRNKLSQEDIDNLFIMVKDSPHISEWDKLTAREGLANLLGETGGKVPTESQLKHLHKVFGKELTDALLDKRSLFEKLKDAGLQIANLPRSMMSTVDFSFGLRQGVFAAPRNRKQFFDSWTKQFGWFGSEKSFQEAMKLISENTNYPLAVESGVAFTEMDSLISEREERFASQWADKLPIVRASSRAYTGFANKYRMDLFDKLVKDAESLGLKPQENADLTKSIAEFVNNATGRGSLGGLENSAVALNAFFFSPRLMASRMNLLGINPFEGGPAFYTKQSPFVRKEALKTLLTFVGTGATILGAAKLLGADVGVDPRSSDFGKIKIGKTRIDIWGGFQQYARMIGQLLSGQYVSSTTGKVLTLGEGYKPLTRLDILMRQIESKESPIFSFIATVLKGQDFQGKPINISQEVALRFVPMVLQDLYDVIKDNPQAFPAIFLAPFGVGIQTYAEKPSTNKFKTSTFKKSSSFKQ